MTENDTWRHRENMGSPDVTTSIGGASIEISPAPNVEDRLSSLFPGENLTVNVMTSSDMGINPTLQLAELLVHRGFHVVPHISAQEIEDESHLDRVATTITRLGISDVFAVKGDDVQKGTYKTSAQIIRGLTRTGAHIRSIGIGGYPEGIEGVSADQLITSIKTRVQLAEDLGAQLYIVTQMCFDAKSILGYIDDLRENGIEIPIIVGLPNADEPQRLYQIATKCKVGSSREKLLTQGVEEFNPQTLVDEITASGDNASVSGYHIYTFNRLKRASELLRKAPITSSS